MWVIWPLGACDLCTRFRFWLKFQKFKHFERLIFLKLPSIHTRKAMNIFIYFGIIEIKLQLSIEKMKRGQNWKTYKFMARLINVLHCGSKGVTFK